jgi:outer membrane protein assembly factor BamE (lipoprotein component of BamABCDE complex)
MAGTNIINASMAVVLISLFSLGCGLVKNPMRDYADKPFNSQDWLKGDSVERGRMIKDLFTDRSISGKTKDEILKTLGEPDKKSSVEGREVWLYRVDFAYRTPMKYFPVSFDPKKGSFAGRIKGDTISMLVED